MDQVTRDAINAKRHEKYACRPPEQIASEALKRKQRGVTIADQQKPAKVAKQKLRRANVSQEQHAEMLLKRTQLYAITPDQKKADQVAKQKERRSNASQDINADIELHPSDSESHDVRLVDELNAEETQFELAKHHYDSSMKNWPSTACNFCDRTMYPIGLRKTVLKSQHIEVLQSYNVHDYAEASVVLLCHTCHAYLQKKKLSGQSKYNLMEVPKSPACITDLSPMEIRLISQVKLHMKIFKLCNNTGQYGIKGSVIHFAQAINEIADQLPLTSVQSKVVVVAETLESVQSRREFEIRPASILTALNWLQSNNPLYKDIHIVERTDDDLSLQNIVVLTQPIADAAHGSHFVTKALYAILRGTIRMAQANKLLFPVHGGKQCTTNCAAFIAYSSIQELCFFKSTTLDQILLDGDKYYSQILQSASEFKKQEIVNNYGFLRCDDLAEDLHLQFCNNNVTIHLQVIDDDALRLNGLLQKGRKFNFNGSKVVNDTPTLENAIRHFLTMETQACILTTAQYSMAIYKQGQSVYYFDSHSRTETGRVCTTDKGLACLIKFPLEMAAKQISSLVHTNVQPIDTISNEIIANLEKAEATKTDYANKFLFSIFPIIATSLHRSAIELQGDSSCEHDVGHTQNNLADSTATDVHSVADLGFGYPQHTEHIYLQKTLLTLFDSQPNLGFGLPQHSEHINPQSAKHVIDDLETYFCHNIDYNEPEIENYIENFKRENVSNPMQLHRATGPPIKTYLENHLKELSFVALFPHGSHGFNDDRRKIKLSPVKYFQARIMSSDTRFYSKEYLCYALDRIEQFKIEQQIGIVCNMTHQGRNNNYETPQIPGAHNPHLYLKAIRGGASYWKNFGADVFAMVNMLAIPTFFLTLSTDDINCPELINAIWKSKHGNESECPFESLSYNERKQLLDDNPVLAARYFCTKVKQVLGMLEKHGKLLFGRKVLNYIGRVEFQARGSGHFHMLIWCENTPDYKTDEGVAFINKNVSVSLQGDNHELVKKYQTHKHTPTCKKNSNAKVCRFNFPREAYDETKVRSKKETHRNHGQSIQYATKPDETSINNYHPKLLGIIRSNMDIQVVGDVNDVIYYIAKYISKAEPEKLAADLQDALVAAKSSTSDTIRKNLLSVANVVTRNRQIGLPEAAFRVLSLPLRFCTKSFQFVSAFTKDKRLRMIQKERLRDNRTITCMNIIERYELRPETEEMQTMCLFEFAALFDPKPSGAYDDVDEEMEEDFNVIEANANLQQDSIQLLNNKGVMCRRKNPKVVKFPIFNMRSQTEEYHYSLLLMYLAFRNEDEILVGYENASSAFVEKRQFLRTEDNTPLIRIGLREELNRALLRLQENPEFANVLNFENNNCQDELYVDDLEVPQQNPPMPDNILDIINSRTATFSSEQKQVYDLVRKQIRLSSNLSNPPLRLFVSGEGGTGKSYVIQTLTLFIRSILHGVGDPLQIAAPTACAAIPISGLTLHRSFGIPVEMGHKVPPYRKLSAATLQGYRRRYKFLKWIILDEVSMISYETFEYISRRLQDIFESTEPFGNINILVFGDILQLKPCNGNWIYKHPSSMKASTDLWRLFSFVELKVNHRQIGSDPLKGICSRLRVGNTSLQDLSDLMTRVLGRESTWNEKIKDEWKDVIRIFPTNKLANNCNNDHIESLKSTGLKIYTVKAVDKYADGNEEESPPSEVIHDNVNKTAGIPTQLQIGLSVRIMLRCNLSLEDKLVNGSRGAIKAITWPRLLPDQSYDGQLPQSISVLFDDPTAGGYLKDKDTGLVCIEPKLFDFLDKRGRKIHRTMLPCILVAGITCHKVQGQTVSRAVIQLKGWNIFKGGAYVALSRCTSLQGLAITEFDSSELIATDKFCPAEKSSMEEYERLRELPSLE